MTHTIDATPDTDGEAMQALLSELQRYAGWLSRDHASAALKANVLLFVVAHEAGDDTSGLLALLDQDLAKLPGGGIRTILRRVLKGMRALPPSSLRPGG